jgi:hypothetical protein
MSQHDVLLNIASPSRRYRRMALMGLMAFWGGVGLYWLSLSTSLIGYQATRLLSSLAASVILPTACVTMLAAGVPLIYHRDARRGPLLLACIASMLLVVYYFYVVFGHSGAYPLRRFGTQFTYRVVKAFYNPSGVIGPPRVV